MKVFVETSRGLPLVTLTLGFRGGSVDDPADRAGVSRVMARTMRRGAAGLDMSELEERIDRLGAELSIESSLSQTVVHAEVIERNLVPFVELLSDVLGSPTFDQQEVDKQKREQAAEIVDARDSDRSLCGRALRRHLFEDHPLGRRVSGSLSSLDAIRLEDVRARYESIFVRSGACVAISGPLSEAQGQAIAEQVLAKLPRGSEPKETLLPAPARTGRHLVLVERRDRSQVQLILGSPGSTPKDADHLAWMVGNTAFGGTFTSWLMQEVRVKRGWSYGANSRIGYDRVPDAFTISSAPSAADAAACLELLVSLSQKAKNEGLSEDELTFTKNYLTRSHAFEIDTARKRVALPLEEAMFGLEVGIHTRFLERVAALSLADVNGALRNRMPDADFVVAAVASKKGAFEELSNLLPWTSISTLKPDFE